MMTSGNQELITSTEHTANCTLKTPAANVLEQMSLANANVGTIYKSLTGIKSLHNGKIYPLNTFVPRIQVQDPGFRPGKRIAGSKSDFIDIFNYVFLVKQ